VGHNHLRVSFGAESARLEKGLFVPDATGVDVEASLNVINSIYDEVKALPELVVEGGLSAGVNVGGV
jgi:hypothetical protein